MIYSRQCRNNFGYQVDINRPDVISQFNLNRMNTNKYYMSGASDISMGYNVEIKSGVQVGGCGSCSGRGMTGGLNPEAGDGGSLSGTIGKALLMLKAVQTIPQVISSRPANAIRNTYGRFMNKNANWRPGFAGELHMRDDRGVTYNWCGPGTNVAERLKRGDPPINELDAACKKHDIAYSYKAKSAKDVRAADQQFLGNVSKSKGNWGRKQLIKGIFKAKMTGEDLGIIDPGKFANLDGDEKPPAEAIIGKGKKRRRKDPARMLRKRIKNMTKKKNNKKGKGLVGKMNKKSKNSAMQSALRRLRMKMNQKKR